MKLFHAPAGICRRLRHRLRALAVRAMRRSTPHSGAGAGRGAGRFLPALARQLLPVLAGLLLAAPAARAESLFNEAAYRGLATDLRAWRVGDTVTVLIVENASASTNADTTNRRNNDLAFSLNASRHDPNNLTLNVKGDFDGGGRTQRASRLAAQLTVTIAEVLPNGQLRLAGTQEMRVNDELQRISVAGLIRPADISDGNVVLSSRLADASIRYDGEGILTERQRRAWWRQALDWLGF